MFPKMLSYVEGGKRSFFLALDGVSTCADPSCACNGNHVLSGVVFDQHRKQVRFANVSMAKAPGADGWSEIAPTFNDIDDHSQAEIDDIAQGNFTVEWAKNHLPGHTLVRIARD